MTQIDDHHNASDLASFQARLAGTIGPRYWRSLDELAGTPEFQTYLAREFPSQADQWTDPDSRRQFLRLMGASLALAGVTGCAIQPQEEIVPYVRQPEALVPGRPLMFATAVSLGGYGLGVLAESHEGRPTKIEGNSLHPASRGATDTFAQAEVLQLYDPDRSQTVLLNGRPSSWDTFLGRLTDELTRQRGVKGAGLRILTGQITSPTQARLLKEILDAFPQARWHQYEPVSREAVLAGTKLAFGEALEPIPSVSRADVIVSFDADFLGRGPGHVRVARDFASRREPGPGGKSMNRLYVAESTPTITGAMADHRLALPSDHAASLIAALASRVGIVSAPAPPRALAPDADQWVHAVAKDLLAHKGASVVLVGEDQPAVVQALGHLINEALGNSGKTVSYIRPVLAHPERDFQGGSLGELAAGIRAKSVDLLVVLGGNPVFSAPVDLDFAKALDQVPFSAYLGTHEDETTLRCRWHIPMAHSLESWGDVRTFDGTATIQQPLIAPLFRGRSPVEMLAAIVGRSDVPALNLVRETWEKLGLGGTEFETHWRKAVHDGVVPGTASPPRPVMARTVSTLPSLPAASTEGLELVFRPDPTIWDGQYANNGWLQELPKPLTKITWDNYLQLSPTQAGQLGLKTEDLVELEYLGRKLEVAVAIVPGHADDSATLTLGYGRTHAGRVGTGAGFNAYLLRESTHPTSGRGLTIRKTGRQYRLACTQNQQAIDPGLSNRDPVLVASIGAFQRDPGLFHEEAPSPDPRLTLSETPEPQHRRQEEGHGNAWAMAINLNTCIGCGACSIACQAENNIPVIGKKQVIAGRAMHWIRVDHYYKGGAENPRSYFQPVPCMHCEKAPCELVCPVAATTHSAEGLNEMTYNRCVGTRYCGNNCPYKVRRFNFLQYSDLVTASLKFVNNPDVTVRSRGVMEKCTYCVQRLTNARIAAEKKGNEQVRSVDVVTACQQVCPTRAIVFGNLNDVSPDNAIREARANPRNYALLAGLGTRPRTTYLAKLTNPNTELEAE